MTATHDLKGQAQRGAERRQAILDAAIEVFAQHGFRGGALAEVAERVGIGAPAVLYHFGSKEKLLLEVLKERDRRSGRMMAELPSSGGLASLMGIVRFATLNEQERGLAAMFTVLQSESFEPDSLAHRYFLERSRRLRSWLCDVLNSAKEMGQVSNTVDTERTACRVLAFMEGAAVLWLLDPDTSLVGMYEEFFGQLGLDLTPSQIRSANV